MGAPGEVSDSKGKTHVIIGARGGAAEVVDLANPGQDGAGFHVQLNVNFVRPSAFFFDTKALSGHGFDIDFVHTYGAEQASRIATRYLYSLAAGSLEAHVGPYFGTREKLQRPSATSVGGSLAFTYQIPLLEYDCGKTHCEEVMNGPLTFYVDLGTALGATWRKDRNDGKPSLEALLSVIVGLSGYF